MAAPSAAASGSALPSAVAVGVAASVGEGEGRAASPARGMAPARGVAAGLATAAREGGMLCCGVKGGMPALPTASAVSSGVSGWPSLGAAGRWGAVPVGAGAEGAPGGACGTAGTAVAGTADRCSAAPGEGADTPVVVDVVVDAPEVANEAEVADEAEVANEEDAMEVAVELAGAHCCCFCCSHSSLKK